MPAENKPFVAKCLTLEVGDNKRYVTIRASDANGEVYMGTFTWPSQELTDAINAISAWTARRDVPVFVDIDGPDAENPNAITRIHLKETP